MGRGARNYMVKMPRSQCQVRNDNLCRRYPLEPDVSRNLMTNCREATTMLSARIHTILRLLFSCPFAAPFFLREIGGLHKSGSVGRLYTPRVATQADQTTNYLCLLFCEVNRLKSGPRSLTERSFLDVKTHDGPNDLL